MHLAYTSTHNQRRIDSHILASMHRATERITRLAEADTHTRECGQVRINLFDFTWAQRWSSLFPSRSPPRSHELNRYRNPHIRRIETKYAWFWLVGGRICTLSANVFVCIRCVSDRRNYANFFIFVSKTAIFTALERNIHNRLGSHTSSISCRSHSNWLLLRLLSKRANAVNSVRNRSVGPTKRRQIARQETS